MKGRRTFHWPLEFPEVILDRGGFDAFVCNPPFVGGGRISTLHGDSYLGYLLLSYPHAYRSVDLSAYFFLRAYQLSQQNGQFGLIATNSIAEGDTKKAGLEWMLNEGASIRLAQASKWPGTAAVEIVFVVLSHTVCRFECAQWSTSGGNIGRAVELLSRYALYSSFHEKLYNRDSAHTAQVAPAAFLATEPFWLLHRSREQLSMPAEHPLTPRSCRVSLGNSLISLPLERNG